MLTLPILLFSSLVTAHEIHFTSTGNPILADGSHYSADPAPIVVDDKLYIIAGEDTAPIGKNDFFIKNWNLFSTESATPEGGNWTLCAPFLKPHETFAWANESSAFAAQIVRGPRGRFFLYAPVWQNNASMDEDPFGIGVAVADDILDLGNPTKILLVNRPFCPIVSDSFPPPGNDIENIDPTVLVDDDERVYMYWGTFGSLKGVELKSDMVTFASNVTDITSLEGFFEAPWIMKRRGTYYLLYADNNVTSSSHCTPTLYHACIAYGTASSPMGPWTYRGVILGIVSSTTSHPGAIEWNGQWYLIYHTSDAKDGGIFRRSIAWDRLTFNDYASPPAIQRVQQTKRPSPKAKPTLNRAQLATPSSDPICLIQYWIAALNDEKVNPNPLPPEYWSSWNDSTSQVNVTLTYTWNETVALNGTSMVFWANHDAGDVEGAK
ncbi:glycoside hydrolase family 43 protein [Pseudocercospora fijiensis CIRAD86]|uniref:Glycoside hydrolase family 43 protein n=1 Tax=Pseudocercospora fijiensis (strain CIRAD86) TaxID=383855 RepID=M3ARY1_PSEFD|nr:glycoside hydrolase family 43 protein [Pseudocercospora fijiensis CIRAD86]EME79858.1 glycoside hydrolase family 43 protein [Pseudocercospora fijiensis CIRAD86]